MIYEREFCDDEGDLSCTHLFPRVLGYKRGSDMMEGDIMEVRVNGFK